MNTPQWKIEQYMRRVAEEYVDPLTGEVNATKIAEDACAYFDAYDDDDIPDDFFEWAQIISENYEALYQTVDAAGLP